MNSLLKRLPFPVSVNQLYRANRGRNILSKRGRAYKNAVDVLYPNEKIVFPTERLRLVMHVVPPDRRRRDIDNLTKCCIDSCKRWISDDEQIDDLRIIRYLPDEAKEGFVIIELEAIGNQIRLQGQKWDLPIPCPEVLPGREEKVPKGKSGRRSTNKGLERSSAGPL